MCTHWTHFYSSSIFLPTIITFDKLCQHMHLQLCLEWSPWFLTNTLCLWVSNWAIVSWISNLLVPKIKYYSTRKKNQVTVRQSFGLWPKQLSYSHTSQKFEGTKLLLDYKKIIWLSKQSSYTSRRFLLSKCTAQNAHRCHSGTFILWVTVECHSRSSLSSAEHSRIKG